MSGWHDDAEPDYSYRAPGRRRSWGEPDEDYERRRLLRPDRPAPHSGFGIVSFIISLLAGVLLIGFIVVAGIVENTHPGALDDENSPQAMLAGLAFLAIFGLSVLGGVLGIVGVALPHRNKTFAIVGLALNSLIALGTIALACAGLMME
jgi:hypothetical protein